MIRLLIADDHPIVREGLKSVVSTYRDIQVVGEAANAEETLGECIATNPDVLLLDVSMPGPGVLEVIHRLKTQQPSVRILVLSVHSEEHYARRVLKAGADGYVTKSYTPDVLYGAIRQVYSGRKYVTPSMAEQLANEVARESRGQPHEALSNREYEVFLQLGSGRKVDEIAQQLKLKPKTVRCYRSRILEKTNLKSTAEIIFYVISSGLVSEMFIGAEDRSDDAVSTGRKPRQDGKHRKR